jgi:hypothetical protein
MLRWIPGRQVGSYAKMALIPTWLSNALNCDVWLLKLPKGCSVIRHRDPVAPGYKHIRLNITLTNTQERMYIEGPIKRWWRFEIFRPDTYFHGMTPITKSMYILSLGCRV